MRRVNYIPEIRAEFLLNYLYPEVGDQWIVQNEGTFYRNYNSDLLSIDNTIIPFVVLTIKYFLRIYMIN